MMDWAWPVIRQVFFFIYTNPLSVIKYCLVLKNSLIKPWHDHEKTVEKQKKQSWTHLFFQSFESYSDLLWRHSFHYSSSLNYKHSFGNLKGVMYSQSKLVITSMCMYMYAYWGRPYRYSLTAQLQGCSKDNTMFFKKNK